MGNGGDMAEPRQIGQCESQIGKGHGQYIGPAYNNKG